MSRWHLGVAVALSHSRKGVEPFCRLGLAIGRLIIPLVIVPPREQPRTAVRSNLPAGLPRDLKVALHGLDQDGGDPLRP